MHAIHNEFIRVAEKHLIRQTAILRQWKFFFNLKHIVKGRIRLEKSIFDYTSTAVLVWYINKWHVKVNTKLDFNSFAPFPADG